MSQQAGARFIAQSMAFVTRPEGARVLDETAPLWLDGPPDIANTNDAIRVLEEATLQASGIALRYGFFYGPGTWYAERGALAELVRKRMLPITGNGEGVSSFIHIDDAVDATARAIDRGSPGIYNICDDQPVSQHVYLTELARLLGARSEQQSARVALTPSGTGHPPMRRSAGTHPLVPAPLRCDGRPMLLRALSLPGLLWLLVGCTGQPGNPATCSTQVEHTAGGPDGLGGCWPGPENTGVPAGVTLTDYTGPCVLTEANTVIDGKRITCGLEIRAANITIRNSRIEGNIANTGEFPGASFTLVDSEVHSPRAGESGMTGVGEAHFTVERVEVTGGNRSIYCRQDCTVRDSWVHGQDLVQDIRVHASGIRQSQGSTLIHNSIHCDVADTPAQGGCSANLTGYGDFEPVQRTRVEKNLFLATPGGACAYGGSSGDDGSKPYGDQASEIVFVDNVFQRGEGNCGYYFPITDFDSTRPGNQWTNNRWEDGVEVPPSN